MTVKRERQLCSRSLGEGYLPVRFRRGLGWPGLLLFIYFAVIWLSWPPATVALWGQWTVLHSRLLITRKPINRSLAAERESSFKSKHELVWNLKINARREVTGLMLRIWTVLDLYALPVSGFFVAKWNEWLIKDRRRHENPPTNWNSNFKNVQICEKTISKTTFYSGGWKRRLLRVKRSSTHL